MTRLRIAVTAAVAVLWACGGRAPIPDAFPETLGGWRRTSQREVVASQPPDEIPAKAESIREAAYEGPGKLVARVYALSSPAVALDVAQNWRPGAQTVFFYSDRFFVVVHWETGERKALQEFVGALERKFGGAGKGEG
jgi:hypothetical protein